MPDSFFAKKDELNSSQKKYISASMLFVFCVLFSCNRAMAENSQPEDSRGKQVYDYYCYQCHGYSGDAQTLASSFLDPAPRNFTATSKRELSRQSMQDTVTYGKNGTAMMAFSSVLSTNDIEAVVDYIRSSFMGENRREQYYHTVENGWPDHARYRAAFPYVSGEIALETPGEHLDAEQLAGKRLYLAACISCHDQPRKTSALIWETRAVSYPRRHYSHRLDNIDAVTGATRLYSRHEQPVVDNGFSMQEKLGRELFIENCAFCHAPDGTGKNWIGSFLDQKPRDFTADDFVTRLSGKQLTRIIKRGVAGTSMPAWENVLTEAQINSIVSFLKRAFGQNQASTR